MQTARNIKQNQPPFKTEMESSVSLASHISKSYNENRGEDIEPIVGNVIKQKSDVAAIERANIANLNF